LERIANAPESIAWLAIIAARIATMKVGQNKGPAPAKRFSFIYNVFIASFFNQEAKLQPKCFWYLGWIYRRCPQHSLEISSGMRPAQCNIAPLTGTRYH
jgi:hypothetical protein